MKEALISTYSSCYGLQFKILKAFPNTVKASLQQLKELDKDLIQVKLLHFNQIIKYLPQELLEDPDSYFLPLVFVHRFNEQDSKLKKLADKIWEQYSELTGGSQKLSQVLAPHILLQLNSAFESASYSDRIAASAAFAEIVVHSKDEV